MALKMINNAFRSLSPELLSNINLHTFIETSEKKKHYVKDSNNLRYLDLKSSIFIMPNYVCYEYYPYLYEVSN